MLEDKASKDTLTGLLNRGAFEEQFKNKMKTLNDSEEFAFILVDIDDFKKFNDNYGHQLGDAVICILADVLLRNFEQDDLVARLGGDEFAVASGNVKCLESIKRKIETIFTYLSEDEKQLNLHDSISISIGAARFPYDGSDFENLYNSADYELYKVKKENKCSYSIKNN